MTVAELIEALNQYPADRRVMIYDFEQHDQWLDLQIRTAEVKSPEGAVAKYGKGATIVSVGLGERIER
jgi:hypothetical protein